MLSASRSFFSKNTRRILSLTNLTLQATIQVWLKKNHDEDLAKESFIRPSTSQFNSSSTFFSSYFTRKPHTATQTHTAPLQAVKQFSPA